MKKLIKKIFAILGFQLVNNESFNKLLNDHHKNRIEKVESENALKKMHRNCFIDNRCVWSISGESLLFNDTENPILSSIKSFSDTDFLSDQRISKGSYQVSTVSLQDLLKTYNAPFDIDYLSIDTEGSELDTASFQF